MPLPTEPPELRALTHLPRLLGISPTSPPAELTAGWPPPTRAARAPAACGQPVESHPAPYGLLSRTIPCPKGHRWDFSEALSRSTWYGVLGVRCSFEINICERKRVEVGPRSGKGHSSAGPGDAWPPWQGAPCLPGLPDAGALRGRVSRGGVAPSSGEQTWGG